MSASRAGRTEKACGCCGETKPLAEFHRAPLYNSAEGRASMCKPCQSKYARRLRYGIDYDEWYEKQSGRCAICGRGGKLWVDHNHKTGKVRGLLCPPCNMGVGIFIENPVLLDVAIAYVNDKGVG